MRFVSKYRKYNITYQREIVEHFATGESHIIKPFITCQFDLYGSMLPHEIKAAREQFINRGLPTEVDYVTTIDPAYRFSVFDTVACQQQYGFDDATRQDMEQYLLSADAYGTDFIMVEAPKLAPPWPTYDSFRGVRGLPTAQAIVKRVREDGYAIDEVLAYERQNADRQDVVDALLAAQRGEPIEEADDEELIEA